MRATFYGVRGSLPIPGPKTVRYGGNTSCLNITTSCGQRLIVDAGTGIHKLGMALPQEGACHLLILHTHWDHISGLPFFAPLYLPGWKIELYVPQGHAGVLSLIMNGQNFPLRAQDLAATVSVHEYQPGQTLEMGSVRVDTFSMPHPGGGTGVRLTDNWTLALSGDCELNEQTNKHTVESLLADAQVAVVDGQYSESLYQLHRGWGHSAREAWIKPARSAGVDSMVFTHHDISSTDADLDRVNTDLQRDYGQRLPHLFLATEGSMLTEGKPHVRTFTTLA